MYKPIQYCDNNRVCSTRDERDVYNLRGEEVTRLIDGEMPSGSHSAIWDASNIASGIYFYRLQSGDFVQTRKMVLLK